MSDFDWDDLKYFLRVAEDGTVSGAARWMGVDHATVIRRIDRLERATGARLFERTPRGYGLTRSGERLLDSARRIGEEADLVGATLGDDSAIGGSVRISCLEGFGNFFLAPLLPELKRSYPRLRIELLTIQQIVALSSREAHIAITVNPPSTLRFESTKLIDYALFVYGAADYLARRPIGKVADLGQHSFSGYIDELVFSRDLDYLAEVSPGLKADLQSSSLHAQMQFALAGHGLCVLPAFIARQQPGLVAVLPDVIRLSRTYWIVTPEAQATTAARSVARFIASKAEAAGHIFSGPA